MNHIDIIEYKEGIKQLVKYAISKKLIPVFGADLPLDVNP